MPRQQAEHMTAPTTLRHPQSALAKTAPSTHDPKQNWQRKSREIRHSSGGGKVTLIKG
jgi:hypothetical protein